MTKKQVEQVLFDVTYSSFEDLKKKIAEAENRRNDFVDGELYFRVDYKRSYYDSVDVNAEIYGYRLETDQEEAKRVREENAVRERQERYDRENYERLKKKYGNE